MADNKGSGKKNKIGRPTKYKEEFCDIVINLMAEGGSLAECCAEIGIVNDTWYHWINKHTTFSGAVKMGTELSKAWWEKHGRTNLKDRDFNHVLWMMNMKNRFHKNDSEGNGSWAEKQQIDHTSSDGTMTPKKPEYAIVKE
ncbi:MAG: helix-turn-helix domain-containing protein [Alphaproteobacteria bacterium]|nr:helix-turn-helix domain-containing protein [Alphaproteobacteria bacterium]